MTLPQSEAPVRVLFDMFELSPSSGKSIGIYVYAVGLLRALKDCLPRGMELVVACHGENMADLQAAAGASIHLVRMQARHPGMLRRQWWLRWGAKWMARQHGCSAYFSPKGFMPGWWGPSWGLRTCVVVHDLIPLWYAQHHPQQFSLLERALVNGGLLRSCRFADQVIAISEATAQDIRHWSGRQGPMTVVHNGLSEAASADAGARSEPYILAMATPLPHKNAAGLLEGYRLYRQQTVHPLPLVVVGLDGVAPEGVTFVKGLSRPQLASLYAGAELFVFLSLIEGFGYPPLEAMQQGTLSICSDIPVLRETTQGHAIYVNPEQPLALAHALQSCLSAEFAEAKRRMECDAPKIAARYRWAETAANVAHVFSQWLSPT
ncbi:MAG: glycosyltransferase family 4 protein [Burkholderiales bacterium]|nr:glycosyltransferase family 4 protein [Burkholderiales bacterium]MDE2433945.1 glycosyltransferase family 4 protein [Burkholderiales bacterium]